KRGRRTKGMAHRDEIELVIAPHLVSIGLGEVGEFLDSIRDRSGLLVERGLDIFGFQHQTFQEYLAAREIAERGKVEILISHFGDAYWREVTLLCAGIRDASDLVMGILSLSEEKVTEHWKLLLQVRKEAQYLNEETRKALVARPLDILKQATDPTVAVRAALHLRHEKPDFETLVRAFDEAQEALAKGHLALLLGETGDARAVGVLKPRLTDKDHHVRYLSALALELLGFDERKVLDDVLMVKVPAGEFTMGSEQGYEDEKPQRRIPAEAFLIDRFPLTNGQYQRFIDDGGYEKREYWSKEGWKWKKEYDVSEPRFLNDPAFNVLSAPVVGISWYEAEAYAKWAGKRFPNEREWERAARGDEDARAYPWGDAFETGRCNADEVIGQPTPVGSYPGGISPHGCYDMAGNVWEWTESLSEKGEPYRVVRGGSWSGLRGLARCAVRYRAPHDLRLTYLGVRFSRTP
ncbi:MAG: SUMF1/EgtB/PvdO family nonheme iron enzyme, partial [Candidatus Latescibacteria bacterium]|nr:SUMF1/EgtB/PvdO family nonheme iron enzyme [Candidatus Latescibacterota bacterium]